MKTLVKHVTVINTLRMPQPILVESICEEFFGITDIEYLFNIHSNMVGVYVSTQNQGTVDVVELGEIQKRLNADSLSIRMELKGLGYVLHYKIK